MKTLQQFCKEHGLIIDGADRTHLLDRIGYFVYLGVDNHGMIDLTEILTWADYSRIDPMQWRSYVNIVDVNGWDRGAVFHFGNAKAAVLFKLKYG